MATIHSLAVETLAYIFELAHDPRTTQTMLSASLVCQAWRHPAQHVLCQDVVISIHYSLETSPGGFAAPDFFEYHQRWEAWYLARRTCAPLRVELVSGSGARKVVVTELAWCSGVRHLVLNNVDISASFLTDSHMRDLESLTLQSTRSLGDREALKPLELDSLSLPPSCFTYLEGAPDDELLGTLLQRYKTAFEAQTLHLRILVPSALERSGKLSEYLQSLPQNIRPSTLTLAFPLEDPAPGEAHLVLKALPNLDHITLCVSTCSRKCVESLLPSIPPSVTVLSIMRSWSLDPAWSSRSAIGLDISIHAIPFSDLLQLVECTIVTRLTTLRFMDCRRNDMLVHAASSALLVECQRQGIQVLCWEDVI